MRALGETFLSWQIFSRFETLRRSRAWIFVFEKVANGCCEYQ
jgi:hypothetical protein